MARVINDVPSDSIEHRTLRVDSTVSVQAMTTGNVMPTALFVDRFLPSVFVRGSVDLYLIDS